MAKESMVRIAEAEKAAQEEAARAKDACEELIRNAEAEAKQIVEAARASAQKRIDSRVTEAKAAAVVVGRNAADGAKQEAAGLAKSAANARDKAISMVIETLVS